MYDTAFNMQGTNVDQRKWRTFRNGEPPVAFLDLNSSRVFLALKHGKATSPSSFLLLPQFYNLGE